MASRSFPAYRSDRDFAPAFGRNDGLEKRHCFLRRHEIRDELRPDWADIAPPQATHTVYKDGGDVKEKPEDLLRPSPASAVSFAAAISRVPAPPSGRPAPPRRRRFPRRERPPGQSSPFHGSAGVRATARTVRRRSEEHTSELQSPDHLVCRLLLEKKKKQKQKINTEQRKEKKK